MHKMSGKFQKVNSPAGSVVSNPNSNLDEENVASPRRGRKESEQRRRVLMNQYFDELIMLLSMISEKDIPRKMDKVTTLREAVNCIQVYYDLSKTTQQPDAPPKGAKTPKASPQPPTTKVNQSLLDPGRLLNFFIDSYDMFMVVVSESGRILYSTELITSLLGHLQTRLVGQNIYDYVHQDDHELIQKLFDISNTTERVQVKNSPIFAHPPKTFDCRFQLYGGETGCFPQYLPFLCLSYLREWNLSGMKRRTSMPPSPLSEEAASPLSTSEHQQQSCLIILGKLPTTFTLIDLSVGTNDVNFEFEMRITCEGRIIDLDKHASLVFGYMDKEIIGSSFFEYIDPYHIMDVGEGFSTILGSGLGTTTPYRILTKGGRYVWLISKGYLSYDPWNNKPDHILLMNRALGCDQVLPEHRFFRSRKLLPDTDGNEHYTPAPIKLEQPSSCPPHPPCTQLPHNNQIQASSQPLAPPPQPSLPQHMPSSLPTLPSSLPTLPSLPASMQMQHQQHQQQQQQGVAIGTSIGLPGLQLPGDLSHLLSTTAPLPPSPAITTPSTAVTQSISDIQKQLDQKNQELFELQRKLLEQQMLFEKERNQFYMVTQQVMRCITSVNSLPISGQMDMLVKGVASSPMSSSLTTTPASQHLPVTCSDFAGEGMASWCDTLLGSSFPQSHRNDISHADTTLPSAALPQLPSSTPLPPNAASHPVVSLPTYQPHISVQSSFASVNYPDKTFSSSVSLPQPRYPPTPTNTQHHMAFATLGGHNSALMQTGLSASHGCQSLAQHNAIYNPMQQSDPHSVQQPSVSIPQSFLGGNRAPSLTDILGISLPDTCHS